jgi:hypothetical protein
MATIVPDNVPPPTVDRFWVEQRLLSFQDRYNVTARPFDWRFTGDDLNQLLTRRRARTHRPFWQHGVPDSRVDLELWLLDRRFSVAPVSRISRSATRAPNHSSMIAGRALW